MALELRPTWCLTDTAVNRLFRLGQWTDDAGRRAADRDADHWCPGQPIQLFRSIELITEPHETRRVLDLPEGATVGVVARWACRATQTAGVHVGGPAPIDLTASSIQILIPQEVAGAVELETGVIVRHPQGERVSSPIPDRALVWSDGWTLPAAERELLLEGSYGRIPVRTTSFQGHFGERSGALWAVDLEPVVEAEDLVSNVVTILLNEDVLKRDFPGHGTPDLTDLPASALSGMQVDLVRALTAAFAETMSDEPDWATHPAGTVGSMLALRLTEAFGSVHEAVIAHRNDQAAFDRGLWRRFAPDSWRAS